MEWYQWITFLGAPSAFVCLCALLKEMFALRYGLQSLLRDRLYDRYDHYSEKGYAPIWAKENFDNMYKWYEALGKNGVMHEKYENFMKFSEKPEGGD